MPKICLVADLHHGEVSLTKQGPAAGAMMARFREFVAAEAPDLVIDLGDRISDKDHDRDLVLEREAAAMFAPIAQPIRHINGNHDRDFLSVEENEEILGQSLRHETMEMGDWTLVFWRADTRMRRPGGFVATEHDLTWLAGVVAEATGPLAIFSHVPVSGHSMQGNYWFQENAEASTYPVQAERIRQVLATCRHPLMWASGHVHWNTLTWVGSHPHLTLQSITDSWTCYPQPSRAMAVLELGDLIDWRVLGLDSWAVSLPAAQTMKARIPVLPRFADHPELREKWRSAET